MLDEDTGYGRQQEEANRELSKWKEKYRMLK